MKTQVLEASKKFWDAMEHSDEAGMRAAAHPDCNFVHIGITCRLEEEIAFYTKGIFQPTGVTFHSQTVDIYGNTAIVVSDCDYSLLLDGKDTTHHFAVTEVYINGQDGWKLVQFSFTALVY
jgi:hypothetical protein